MTTLTAGRTTNSRTHRPTLSAPLSRMVLGLTLGLSLVLLYCGLRMFPAGLASFQANAFLLDWRRSGNEPAARAWSVAHDAAQRSITLYPVDKGQYLEQMGHVLQWQWFRHDFAAPEAEASRRQALQILRKAAIARHTWPSSQIDLAWAKLYLLEFDDEFEQALQRAAELGPWRIGINRNLAEIGFLAWPHLNQSQRMATLEAARRTLAYSPREAQSLIKIASDTGMLPQLCEELPKELASLQNTCT